MEVNPQLFETCVQVVEAGILWVCLNLLNRNAEAETVETVAVSSCDCNAIFIVAKCHFAFQAVAKPGLCVLIFLSPSQKGLSIC